jgi:signal transduction histidine kinase
VFLLKSSPAVASAIDTTDRLFTTTIAAAFAILCVWRLVTASAAARRGLLPVAMPALLASASVAAHSVAMVRSPLEGPFKPLYDVNVFIATFVTGCIALILLAGGLVWGSVRTWLQRRAVARIVSRLGEAPDPGSVESALAHALGDPQLTIAYWLPDSERYVDAYGRPAVEPVTMPGRVVSALVIGERQVARVVHAQGPDIEAEMGAAMRLALDNERLQAEGLAQLEELRASRARIVAAGDDERRRLERDLHDGAQQTLLAASYDIRLARSGADTERDAATGSLMTAALDGTQLALDELRELANGIYPAILGEAGLAAALASLADTAPARLEVVEMTTERFSSPIETTAYLLVVEAVEDAATRGASSTTVSVVRDDTAVIVAAEDDGVPRTSAMVRSADRIGALGGHLDVGPVALRAAMPCA